MTARGTVLAARLFRLHGWVDHLGRRRRDAIDPRLSKIALGLLLHDIGKLAAVVKQHHERWDGSGYPSGLSGEEIHQFARVAAVADVYDAVASERVYKPPMTPLEGVTIIEQGNGHEFDLADGRTGLVVDVDPRLPYEPTVRVQRYDGSIEEIERAMPAIPAAV